MKRNIFAVCDLEVDYALNFMDYMNRKKNIPFEIQAFTSVENLIAYGKQTHIELLLISGRAMCREVRDLDIGKIIILSEGVHPPELDQYPSVYKYQSSSDVLREVMACYGAEKKTVADQIAVLKKTTEIIGIFSPLGRCLKTSFALTLGQILAKERAVLYLNMDMEEKLAFLDEHYLSHFDYLDVDSVIQEQKAFGACRDVTLEYPVAENEGEEDNTYLSYNMVVGNAADSQMAMAFEVLDYALLSAPGAPLKQALLDVKAGKDVYGSYDDGILQPYFTVIAKGSNPDRKEEFVSVIRQVLGDIVKNGIDRKAVEAGINYFEFRYREADFSSYPKGLMYSLDILGDWLYEKGNPFAQVQQLTVFENLKKAVNEGYFEELIRKYLLENPHGCIMTLVPKKGLAAQREKELEEKLEAYRSSLSEEQLDAMVEKTKALEAYQEAGEDPKALECIPMLKRSDIKKEAAKSQLP